MNLQCLPGTHLPPASLPPEPPPSPPCPWENSLPQNQSLVPRRLGTAAVEGKDDIKEAVRWRLTTGRNVNGTDPDPGAAGAHRGQQGSLASSRPTSEPWTLRRAAQSGTREFPGSPKGLNKLCSRQCTAKSFPGGFPGGLVVESACQCRGQGLDSWSRKIPQDN